eukprot:TRINITY_DN167_c0_g1_i1.p1 TRINITY_DN167_c0_g1~~TRINITY_DN167_c0_g1_i1.p1  ORF type:complete len:322 (-),score=69.44 TRINITY_DN167_c0_g1_i1:50-1015(-)
MSGKKEAKAKKTEYMNKLVALLEEYPRLFLVICDNIGSHHMQKIRISLRGRGVLLMGKNTLMRKAIKMHLTEHPEWESLLSHIKGNIGMVFTKESLQTIRPKLLESRVPALAKAGIVAPQDVVIPKQVTTLEPTKTTFFAALDIATKITRGCVEILNDITLCKEGDKVGSSEAALMQMLDMKPFTYGLKLTSCYDDGFTFSCKLLDTTADQVYKAFTAGVSNVAALSLSIGYPSLPAFPHIVLNAFKNLAAISLETNYVFEQAKQLKERVENPDAFVVAAAPTAVAASAAPTKAAEPEPEPEPVKEESSEEDVGMDDLFAF